MVAELVVAAIFNDYPERGDYECRRATGAWRAGVERRSFEAR